MALVVLLRGVNVGGHKTFKPSQLAARLKHFDVVNIGAAGTFVIRERVSRDEVRAQFARRLPFITEIMICDGRDIMALIARDHFSEHGVSPDMVRFASLLSRAPKAEASLPISFPATGQWLVRVLARDKRFAVGVYKRHMKTIGYLGQLDRAFGIPITTRNWNTLEAIGKVLTSPPTA